MATIHPSRLGLVPRSSKDAYSPSGRTRGRSPSPRLIRRRSPSPPRSTGRYDRDDRREPELNGRDRDNGYGDRSRKRDRARADDYFEDTRGGRKRSRSRSLERERDTISGRTRRPSPEYSEYKRPASKDRDVPATATAPWRQERSRGYPQGGADWLESRRQQRENSTFSTWPPSPKAPTRLSPSPDSKRHKKSRKHRRDPSSELSSSTDSEEERRRRKRKERRREKEREKEKRKRKSRSKSVRDYDSEEDRRERRRRKRSRTGDDSEERSRSRDRRRHRSKSRTKSPEPRPPSSEIDEDEWVEKPVISTLVAAASTTQTTSMGPPPLPSASTSKAQVEEDSDEEVGPQPPKEDTTKKKVDERQYGGALLRGEGSAMAAFLVDGTDVRIPRRGEIGLSSDEIATYEAVGYVMSGSRHRRMNAVRMRKENQVISAEEKRGILKLQKEERERREAILREEFQQLVEERLKASGSKPSS